MLGQLSEERELCGLEGSWAWELALGEERELELDDELGEELLAELAMFVLFSLVQRHGFHYLNLQLWLQPEPELVVEFGLGTVPWAEL